MSGISIFSAYSLSAGVKLAVGCSREETFGWSFMVQRHGGTYKVLKNLLNISCCTLTLLNNKFTQLVYFRELVPKEYAYWSCLAALKEYAFMKALGEYGFPVPNAVDCNGIVWLCPLFRVTHLECRSSSCKSRRWFFNQSVLLLFVFLNMAIFTVILMKEHYGTYLNHSTDSSSSSELSGLMFLLCMESLWLKLEIFHRITITAKQTMPKSHI